MLVINSKELEFLEKEQKVREEWVILEKSKPSDRWGRGVPKGKLILTKNHLFFFTNTSKFSLKKILAQQSMTEIASLSNLPLERISHFVFEKLNENQKHDLEPFLKNEFSFVIPVKSIKKCEKSGGWLSPWDKTFLRIKITDQENLSEDYCILCNKAFNPIRGRVDHKKWVIAFENVGISCHKI